MTGASKHTGWLQDGLRYDDAIPHPIVGGHCLVLSAPPGFVNVRVTCGRCGLTSHCTVTDMRATFLSSCKGSTP